MSSQIKLKRSAVPGKVPDTSSLQLGELAINTYDGKVFLKESGSQGEVVRNIVVADSLTTGSVHISGSLTLSGSISVYSGSIESLDYIKFVPKTDVNIPYEEGVLYYNSEDGSLVFYNAEADIALTIGQEQWLRGFNNSPQQILDGTPVYISGSRGDNPYIWTASAQDYRVHVDFENHIIGLATHNIESAAVGYVTKDGRINGIDTSTFAAGDTLYLQTGSGGYRNTPPPFPYEIIQIGTVVRSHSNGIIELNLKEPIHFSDISGLSGSVNLDTGELWVYNSAVGGWYNTTNLPGNYTLTGSLEGTSSFALNTGNATSASYAATASYVKNAISASYAPDTTFPYTGNATITGSLEVEGPSIFTGSVTIKGEGTTSATSAFLVENNNNEQIFKIDDNGTVTIGKSITDTYIIINANTDFQFRTSGDQLWLERTNSLSINRFNIRGNFNVVGSIFTTEGLRTSNSIYSVRATESLTGGTGRHAVVGVGGALGNIQVPNLNKSTWHLVVRGGLTNDFKNIGLQIDAAQTANALDIFVGNIDSEVYLTSFTKDGFLTIGKNIIHQSAALEIDNTTRGFLPPRMTETQRNAISSPAEGLTIYNTTTNTNNYYNGTSWISLQDSIQEVSNNKAEKFLTLTAGENLVAGDWCYLKDDGKMWKSNASAEATAKGLVVMATETIVVDSVGSFQKTNIYTTTGLTVSAEYYLDTTAGAITATKPTSTGTIVRLVGYALSATELYIDVDKTYLENE